MSRSSLSQPFTNEPTLELRRASERDTLTAAMKELDARLPLGEGDLVSTDPGNPDRVVARATTATEEDVDRAVTAATEAQPAWGRRPATERAEILVIAAERLRARRPELAALIVREVAKPWAEADADVCEAIDFLTFYAREAIALADPPELMQAPGERNTIVYRPRGLTAVIAPWNFPLAIPCGMTAAALATGNAALLKPAEQAPGCAHELVNTLHAAGVPEEVLHLLPGEGETGQALVRHPGVHTIAFTGSAAVGQTILREAAEVRTGQRHIKRVVAEMGGKNCVLVDGDADLDDAVPAIVASAFGYAGQKCSAAARVIAHEAITPHLAERLAGAIETLQVGQADTFGTDVPPLIEQAAQQRLTDAIAAARDRGIVNVSVPAPEGTGWAVGPTLATQLDADDPLLLDELFGPFLTLEPAKNLAEAIARVEQLPFALTGGLFARDPDTVRRVTGSTTVGNLYVNRAITGAMVARQPFGGNRLSGTGTKAGGPGYVQQFVDPVVVTKNTMRHGIVVS